MTPQKTPSIAENEIKRIIGTIEKEPDGRQIVFFAGIHGNEPAGIIALQRVLKYIKKHKIPFRGKLWALEGNLPALKANRRFIDKDLNRMWYTQNNDAAPLGTDLIEVREREALSTCIEKILSDSTGNIYFFDLHTTSAHSIPFVSISDTLRNRKIVKGIPVPIVLGLEEDMEGTLFNFFSELGISMILFEAGQHEQASSIDNHEAFIWMILVKLKFVKKDDFPDLHNCREILSKEWLFKKRVFQLQYRHVINGIGDFTMIPGFVNFQKIHRGQILAYNTQGAIHSPLTGRIFLPLYQDQGLEGFLIIDEIKFIWLKISEIIRKLGLDRYMSLLPGIRKHKEFQNCYVIKRRVGRFFLISVFRLLGYRKVIQKNNLYIVKRRPFDWEKPSMGVVRQRFKEISQ